MSIRSYKLLFELQIQLLSYLIQYFVTSTYI